MGGNAGDVGLGIATGGLYTVGKKYSDDMKGHKKDMEADQQRTNAAIEEKAAAQKKKEEMEAANEGRRFQSLAMRRSSRRDYKRPTILTSPIGVIGEPQLSGKTLLGS